MKFLIFDHHSSFSPDIISFLNEKEAAISYINSRPRNYYYDPVFRKEVIQNIEETNPDIVFSIHFFPILSNICRQQKIPYVCWCYNDPLNLLLLHNSVTNNCNIIFHTDSQWIEKLQRLGCQQVHYLPWAADSAYLSTSPDRFSSQADVVCLDSVTPEIHTAYNKLLLQTDPRTRGFIEALLQAQETIYGFNFLENACNESAMHSLQVSYPIPAPRETLASTEELYAFFLLYPIITKKETEHLLQVLDQEQTIHTHFYTLESQKHFKHITSIPLPPDSTKIAEIYQSGKINLLISPREIQNGISVPAMHILASGSFLLTNFQNDFLHFFEPEIDYVYYESPKDMLDKVQYYLKHETERKGIAQNARQKILQNHTFNHRMNEMYDILQRTQL